MNVAKYEHIKNKDIYYKILKSGMFWVLFPELQGCYEDDMKYIRSLEIFNNN
jgi:hypothetical protein